MSARYYRLLPGILASLSLALAGCGSDNVKALADAVTGALPARPDTRKVAQTETDDTDMNLWTVLGLAKRETERNVGPRSGDSGSPAGWQGAQDALQCTGR